MKKKILVFAVMLPLLGSLASCQKTAAYDPNNFLESGTAIVKNKVTLTFFAPLHPLHDKEGYNHMRLFQEMEKDTNIHIEWIYGATSNYSEIRGAQWQSKNRPDAFFLWNPVNEVSKYGQSGTIADLSENITKYAPNYNAILAANPSYRSKALMNGKMYSFLSINDVPRDQTFKQFINQKWLKALNLTMPTTLEEYRNVLTHFKEDDPNGNGIPDEIPLSSASLYQSRNFLMSAFGHPTTGVEEQDGTIIYVPELEAYRQYLDYAHSLFSAGLLDNNTFTMDERALAAKGANVGSFDGAAAYLIVGKDKDADYTAIPPLLADSSVTKTWLGFNNVTPTALIVNSACPYQREIVRWMDYLYSQKGIELQSFGLEGTDWDWTDASQSQFLFHVPEGMGIEEYRGTITPAVGLGNASYFSKDFVLKEKNEYTERINQEVADAHYLDVLKIPLPNLVFTDEEASSSSVIQTDLDIYMEVFEQKVITGKLTLTDQEWANHLANLNKLKVADLLSIYQNAYERSEK